MLKAACNAFNILISNDINMFSYFHQSTAYEAHNLKVVGSNPTPATKLIHRLHILTSRLCAVLFPTSAVVEALWKQLERSGECGKWVTID